jgi:hypothetical protein
MVANTSKPCNLFVNKTVKCRINPIISHNPMSVHCHMTVYLCWNSFRFVRFEILTAVTRNQQKDAVSLVQSAAFFCWFTFRPWRLRRNVALKRRLTVAELQGPISRTNATITVHYFKRHYLRYYWRSHSTLRKAFNNKLTTPLHRIFDGPHCWNCTPSHTVVTICCVWG